MEAAEVEAHRAATSMAHILMDMGAFFFTMISKEIIIHVIKTATFWTMERQDTLEPHTSAGTRFVVSNVYIYLTF
jgi:hypothetical protein